MPGYESFISENKDKSYEDLLLMRESLIKNVYQFEKNRISLSEDKENIDEQKIDNEQKTDNGQKTDNEQKINSEQEKNYENNLLCLAKICELILEKYNRVYYLQVNQPFVQKHYLFLIKDFLESKGLLNEEAILVHLKERKEGKEFDVSEHIKGFIYALLTDQTKRKHMEFRLRMIDKLFFDYDIDKLKSTPPEYFYHGLFELKCGNMYTKAQMEALQSNIAIFEQIEKEYKSLDAFVTSAPADEIVKKLSDTDSPYKLQMTGEALTWEYIRNVGIDGAKPDTHLRRFLGKNHLGSGNSSPASIHETIKQVERLSQKTGFTKTEIDYLIWSYCADGYGEICTSLPHCEKCVVRNYCKYEK